MQNKCYMTSPIGTIIIEEDGEAITALYIDKDKSTQSTVHEKICKTADETVCIADCGTIFEAAHDTALLQAARKQLTEYLAGTRKKFELPLHFHGTEFQQKVWKALQQIPYGETRSYGEMAAAVGNPKASRAIGGANNKNPIMIIVPCHRVIGADGSLVGFGGGLPVKKYLLDLEKKYR